MLKHVENLPLFVTAVMAFEDQILARKIEIQQGFIRPFIAALDRHREKVVGGHDDLTDQRKSLAFRSTHV
jgi:hypothetical protein